MTVDAQTRTTDLDTHIRNIIKLHFDDEAGSPYWIRMKRHLSFDPKRDISGYHDLVTFFGADESYEGLSPEGLRYRARDLVPKKYQNPEFRFYASGGRTGTPKWTAWIDEGGWQRVLALLNDCLDDAGVETGRDWAYVGPTGPHQYGFAARDIARQRGGQFLPIDLDPRWVRTAKTDGTLRENGVVNEYVIHLKSQIQDLLTQHETNIGIITSTPTLIEGLAESGVLYEMDLDGVIFAGQAMTPENYRAIEQQLDAPLLGLYGNTVMGVSPQAAFDYDTNTFVYQPRSNLAVIEVVDPEQLTNGEYERVEYGQRGQAVLHVLREGLFAPYFIESDTVDRLEPTDRHRVDAVGNPDIPESKREEIEEGVY